MQGDKAKPKGQAQLFTMQRRLLWQTLKLQEAFIEKVILPMAFPRSDDIIIMTSPLPSGSHLHIKVKAQLTVVTMPAGVGKKDCPSPEDLETPLKTLKSQLEDLNP